MDQADHLRAAMSGQNAEMEQLDTARVITITSGKGGVGKSNTAVNIAVHLRKAGKRVIIFDADFGLANVEVMFHTTPRYTLSDMIFNGKSMRDIITEGPMGIGFVSGGSSIIGLNNLSHDQIRYVVQTIGKLNELADYIIIDTGAGISDQVMEFVVASPEVILVATPDPSSLTDSYSLIKAMYSHPSFSEERTKVSMLANRVGSGEEAKEVYEKLHAVVGQFLQGKIEYIGMIPNDPVLEKAVREQKVVSLEVPRAASAQAFGVLAENLMNGSNMEFRERRGIAHIFSYFLNRL